MEWASCTSYDILGQRVNVRSTSAEFASQVDRLLRSFPSCGENDGPADVTLSLVVAPPAKISSIRPFHFLFEEGNQVGRTPYLWQLFRYLECQLDLILAEKLSTPLLLHAGSVVKGDVGVVIPGESGSGKSSLTLALIRRGFDYFSDEIAVIDPISKTLHPFPKPLTIKDKSVFPGLNEGEDQWFGPETEAQDSVWYVHPEDLGARVAQGPAPIKFLIFPTRVSQRDAQLLPLTSGEALQKLAANSINLNRLGNQGFHLLADLVNDARSYSLRSGDLEASVALVNALIET